MVRSRERKSVRQLSEWVAVNRCILMLAVVMLVGCIDSAATRYPVDTHEADWRVVGGSTIDVFVPAVAADDEAEEMARLVEGEVEDLRTLFDFPRSDRRYRVFVDRVGLTGPHSEATLIGTGSVLIRVAGRLPYGLLIRQELTLLLMESEFGIAPEKAQWVGIGLAPFVAGPCSGYEFRKLGRLLRDGPGLADFEQLEHDLPAVDPFIAEVTSAVIIEHLVNEYGPTVLALLWNDSFSGLSAKYGMDRSGASQVIDGYVRSLDFGERLRISDWTSLTDRCG